MSDPERRIVKLYFRMLIVLGVLVVSVWFSSYESRKAGCERAKADRVVNADGWRTAEAARRASGTPNDLVAADRYERDARSLEARSRISCGRIF